MGAAAGRVQPPDAAHIKDEDGVVVVDHQGPAPHVWVQVH